jgi:hypothetical protein
MRPPTISADHARRFLVRRQLLDPPRSLPASPEAVLTVVERLGSLQFDPLETPGARNHDLVLHARIAGYSRAWCDQWLYGPPAERRLFEAYNKSLNILPIDELPYYRIAWDRAAERYQSTILKKGSRSVKTVLDRLRAEGPLSTAAFSKDMSAAVDWHWAPTAEGRAVLEALFEAGHVGIAYRDRSRRTFDLIDRCFPQHILTRRAAPVDGLRHRLLSRYRAVGLMGTSGTSELTNGTGKADDRARMLAELVEGGALFPVEVEGLRGPRFVPASEVGILEAAAYAPDPAAPRKVSFIGPLDPLLWDRRLLRSLFGFDYIWEVYVPEARRRHGYYVLPVLFGDRFVGRIEPRLDRKTGTLRLLCLVFEEGFEPMTAPGFLPAFGEALSAYQAFVGAKRVAFPRTRLASAVARALRAETGG